jgi:hypothetical protein
MLTEHAGVSRPAVSKHQDVKLAGLVHDRTHYSALPHGLAPLIDWVRVCGTNWQDRIHRLEILLNKMDQ